MDENLAGKHARI